MLHILSVQSKEVFLKLYNNMERRGVAWSVERSCQLRTHDYLRAKDQSLLSWRQNYGKMINERLNYYLETREELKIYKSGFRNVISMMGSYFLFKNLDKSPNQFLSVVVVFLKEKSIWYDFGGWVTSYYS